MHASSQGALADLASLARTRAGLAVTCAINSSKTTGYCAECLSNGNGGYISCDNQNPNLYCPLACYYSSGIPTCNLATQPCNGNAFSYTDSHCTMNKTSAGSCGRSYDDGGTT